MAGIGELYTRVDGAWRQCNYSADDTEHGMFVRVDSAWRRVEEGWVRVDGAWRQFFGLEDEEEIPDKPAAGSYTLSATAQYYGSGKTGYAEFNTSAYRGYITQIRARISWKNITAATFDFSISGRPNGNFYRNIDNPGQYSGRTIDHRIDTFDSSSLTDFNNGNAIGFSYTWNHSGYSMSELLSKSQLVIQVS